MPGRVNLLDDQPATAANDRLHFGRYLAALENTVLAREEITPLVVGLFGPWGSGKSTLLGMLEHKLGSGEIDNQGHAKWSDWVVVKFSPWMYRHEKALLLPLLATLAKKQPAFEKLIQAIVKSGPGLIKKATGTLIETHTMGLPLLTFLDSVRKDKEKAKDLQEKIAEAVKTVTYVIGGEDKRIVFLIDDLDRCHDPAQIVNLLEQIKQFLHQDRCLFFIAADREQVLKAIDQQFPGSGEEYLEKFVQLSFVLPPHHSQHLMNVLDVDEDGQRPLFRSLCEVLDNNPRKLKRIWNEAVLLLEVLKQERLRVQAFSYQPSMELAMKWLLLRNCGALRNNPYLYLNFEKAGKQSEFRDGFIRTLDLKDVDGKWRSEYHRRLGVYLWNDLDSQNKFGTPDILSLYARSCAESSVHSRAMIEEGCFDGGDSARFDNQDFVASNLSGGHFHQAVFNNCNFMGGNLENTDLSGVKFIECNLEYAVFNNAQLASTSFEKCPGLDKLATEPIIYEQIADMAVAAWDSAWDELSSEALFKAYKTILDMHKKYGTHSAEIENRLTIKGKEIRDRIDRAT